MSTLRGTLKDLYIIYVYLKLVGIHKNVSIIFQFFPVYSKYRQYSKIIVGIVLFFNQEDCNS